MRAMVVGDGVPRSGVLRHQARAHHARFVRRVVQHLDFEQLPRIVNVSDRFQQSLDDVAFVENWQLDSHARQLLESLSRLGKFVAVLQIKIGQVITMHPVD